MSPSITFTCSIKHRNEAGLFDWESCSVCDSQWVTMHTPGEITAIRQALSHLPSHCSPVSKARPVLSLETGKPLSPGPGKTSHQSGDRNHLKERSSLTVTVFFSVFNAIQGKVRRKQKTWEMIAGAVKRVQDSLRLSQKQRAQSAENTK